MEDSSGPNVVTIVQEVVTTDQVKGMNRNPTGKGGFQDHPELRSPGGWKKESTYEYWLKFFKNLPWKEFQNYKKDNLNMAALGAYTRVKRSLDSIQEYKEVADRTEGKPIQVTEVSGRNGGDLSVRWNDGSNYTLHAPTASAEASQLQGQVLGSSDGETDRKDDGSSQRTDQESDTVSRE